jgi:2-phosphosulfolactate phosphatase
MFYDQQEFDIRCEWGGFGVSQLAPISDAIVIVDVLSFSTSVDIAVGNGAIVYPYQWKDESALAYAQSRDAILANFERTSKTGYTLSPTSLLSITSGTRLVLPSPNGSTLSLTTGVTPTFAGCLRNAQAIANSVQQYGLRISLIPAGERWPDGSLRPAIEDWVGAGAIIHYLPGNRSPEAELAENAFLHFKDNLSSCLNPSSSGKELIGRDFASDVKLAAAFNQSQSAPQLTDGTYQ